jgi:ELWxxDGT repeat protein
VIGQRGARIQIADISTGAADPSPSSDPRACVTIQGAMWFTAAAEDGRELWWTDGTAGGTQLVIDIRSGSASAFEATTPLFVLGDHLLMPARMDDGMRWWRSGGTAAGTRWIAEIRPGAGGSDPASLVPVGARLVFAARDAVHGRAPIPIPNDPALVGVEFRLQAIAAQPSGSLVGAFATTGGLHVSIGH